MHNNYLLPDYTPYFGKRRTKLDLLALLQPFTLTGKTQARLSKGLI